MISDEDRYLPEKELKTNFTIPRKMNVTNITVPDTVLSHSYYNQPQIYTNVVQTICQVLEKQPKEQPKTYGDNFMQRIVPDLNDTTLPNELKLQFQPFYCKLCSCQLSSKQNAMMHYSSKNHEKKVRKYLMDYSERTGEPLHKRAKIEITKTKEENPKYFHCDICDLPLTGKIHAESHYMGRNHQKAVLGVKKPAGQGHYDEMGRWIREGTTKKSTDGATDTLHTYKCDVCNITTTCHEQLEMHLKGQKHQKKLRQLGELTSVTSVNDMSNDLANYRTPSGQFYCQPCDVTLNSKLQLRQHLQSNNHIKKSK